MKTEESIINLIKSKSLKDSVTRLFDSYPSKERMREILRARKEGSWRKYVPIGVLDDTEVQLVFIKIHLEDLISKSENWSRIDRKIYYGEGGSHCNSEEREFNQNQQKSLRYRSELIEDLEKISEQLTEKIEQRFEDSISSFLELNDLLRKKVHYYKGGILIPGYDFQIYKDSIVVENMYPMGGD